MDSKLSGLPPFDDPEQWWQPDAWDDPDWEPEDPLDALGRVFSSFGLALADGFIRPLAAMFSPPPGAPNPFAPDESLLSQLAEQMKAVEPLLEATEGHWAVCKHKPRCKKPPAYAVFNRPQSESRRSGSKWPIVIRG